jgi:hypothetical protein
MHRSATLLFGLGLLLAACRESPVEPQAARVRLSVLGDSVVFVAIDGGATEQLRVFAAHAASGSPVANVPITWQVAQGSGGVSPAAATTDLYGVAAAWPGQGSAGVFRVTASSPRMLGAAASFEVRAVPRPTIAGVQPATFAAAAEVVITGSGFSTTAAHNAVYFDGLRGSVISATSTELRVQAPPCLPARNLDVRVGLGAVLSSPRNAVSTGGPLTELTLQPGQVQLFTDPAHFSCLRVAASQNGAVYLVGVHNTASAFAPRKNFELRSLLQQALATAPVAVRPPAAASWAGDWEARLRLSERALGPMDAAPIAGGAGAVPAIGERRQFNVIDRENRFQKVNAEVRHISSRAVFYLDVESATAFSDADLQSLGATFDDPIYPTTTTIFGEPSDLDGNQRIIVLFTPRVNMLTPRGQSSYVAGYFYGCDLVAKARCSGTNSAEVFYSMVPDPSGQWSDARSRATVMNSVPPVLAHEFQHMIHFARRGMSADALWISEGLAHTAEELVADVFATRGDNATAAVFRNGNLHRAQMYLDHPASTSMLAEESPGTLEMRGASWLFLRYLRGHFGGNELLRRLTGSTRTGPANVSHETGEPWGRLVADFGVALYADNAPQLQGSLAARYRFPGFNLRAALAALPGGYPLRPTTASWSDTWFTGDVPSASHEYFLFTASASPAAMPLALGFSGYLGAPLAANADLVLTILRIR